MGGTPYLHSCAGPVPRAKVPGPVENKILFSQQKNPPNGLQRRNKYFVHPFSSGMGQSMELDLLFQLKILHSLNVLT